MLKKQHLISVLSSFKHTKKTVLKKKKKNFG